MIQIPPSAIAQWGGAAVFANVLLTRLGVPLPSAPLLLFAGTAVANGRLSFVSVLVAAVAGALIGDGVWFAAGRIHGRKLIAALSRRSYAIDNGMRTTGALFERHGAPIVAVSKFIPGLGLVTPPLMGTTQIAVPAFFLWDTGGIVAWAAFWLLGGALFQRQLQWTLMELHLHGATVIDLLVVLALIFFAYRLLRRKPPHQPSDKSG
ncbi:DedA family protein [Caballeronia sp. LP006]|uniref:DedA family protein n=1 Tax=unclassified Caballeronia TaxID=2646786 RepID=UPI001FCFE896|nr:MULTISPECIES: DedA family protein [unclassified Caballeronia]MDR5775939.1 DedA family protein [Caballeronia sp. LZ002]MDR5828317.1 DedA family protein [Caballeronia sp. LP006]MDR5851378.1 DedA family protein [Caballeronia sp. LZ003]